MLNISSLRGYFPRPFMCSSNELMYQGSYILFADYFMTLYQVHRLSTVERKVIDYEL
jgi:hypothetical protein